MSTERTILEHPDLVIALTEGSARFTLDVYSKVDGSDGKRPIDICVEIGEVESLQAFSDEIGAFADAYSQENRGAVRLREDVAHLKAENERLRALLGRLVPIVKLHDCEDGGFTSRELRTIDEAAAAVAGGAS